MLKLFYQGHGSVRMETPEGKIIYLDPYAGEGYDLPADLILVTHGHYDHTGFDRIERRNEGCEVITYEDANVDGVHKSYDLGFVKVEAVEAENKNHPITDGVGYILTFSNEKQLYFTGDSSTTKQMATFAERKLDYAFFCCDGIYNMDREEASKCAELVGAKYSVPYHIKPGGVFDRELAEEFHAAGRVIVEAGQTLEIE
ncbi:MAG: MBL fold metallo-hydrolase [Firmicutes bacterium]|nr:MBL fold metallo-hydrolase [Bacillota bacterium]